MTEREFRQHVADMDELPDAEDQVAHFAKCAAVALNAITAFLGKPLFGPETLIPWQKRDAAGGLTHAEVEVLGSIFPEAEGVEVFLSAEDAELLARYAG